MARGSVKLIEALRRTARHLATGTTYQWGHMGSCNCGHLAQTITKYSKGEIHGAALWRYGDWSEQLRDYCPQSGLPMDQIIDQMLALGLTTDDLAHLERLSHPPILGRLKNSEQQLRHNVRDDVVLYFETWADMLEEELLTKIHVTELTASEAKPSITQVAI